MTLPLYSKPLWYLTTPNLFKTWNAFDQGARCSQTDISWPFEVSKSHFTSGSSIIMMFCLQGPALEGPTQISIKESILDVISENHTSPCLCPLFTHKCLSLSHSSWLRSQHVSMQRAPIPALQLFCQGTVQVMIYQAPSINFSSTNDGHESCYALTALFLTSVHLCRHCE